MIQCLIHRQFTEHDHLCDAQRLARYMDSGSQVLAMICAAGLR